MHRGQVLISIISVLVFAGTADAAKLEVPLYDSSFGVYAGTDSRVGDFYTVTFELPTKIRDKEILGAYLRLYFDVDAVERYGERNPAPSLQVFSLTAPVRNELDPSQYGTRAWGTRHVPLGEGQVALIDITEIVHEWLSGALVNHGLVIGSLQGDREGLFSLVPVPHENGQFGALIVHFR